MTAKAPLGNKRPFRVVRGSSQLVQTVVSKEFNIDNGSGTTDDEIILYAPRALTLLSATVIYTEATDTAGAEAANVAIGTTAGGVDLVAAVALTAAKAIGSVSTLTLASTAVDAGDFINVRHTGIAATDAGKYRVVLEYLPD